MTAFVTFSPGVALGDLLHLAQHHRGDLGQRELLVADLDADAVVRRLDDLVGADGLRLLHFFGEVVAADQALGRADGLGRRMDHLRLGGVSDLDGPVVAEVHDGSRRALVEGVREHLRAHRSASSRRRCCWCPGRCRWRSPPCRSLLGDDALEPGFEPGPRTVRACGSLPGEAIDPRGGGASRQRPQPIGRAIP